VDEFQAFHLTEKGPDKFWGIQVSFGRLRGLGVCPSTAGFGCWWCWWCGPGSDGHIMAPIAFPPFFVNRSNGPLWIRTRRWAARMAMVLLAVPWAGGKGAKAEDEMDRVRGEGRMSCMYPK
jgi:hypothetical protein